MLNVRVKKALLTILTACLTVLMTIGAVLGFAPTPQTVKADGAYTLVTDASTLAVGDQVVIVAKDSAVALSTTQNGNNRGQTAVTKGDKTVTINDSVQVLTLETGTKDGTFAFNTGSGYLFAASSSKNYLRTETTLSANSSWNITITDGVATIKAQGTNTKNWLRYNTSSSIFSCYSSGQNDVSIYKMEVETCAHENTTTTYDSNDDGTHTVTVTCTAADCGKTVSTTTVDCNYGAEQTIPATETADGRIYEVCKDCGYDHTIQTLPKLNLTKYTLSFSTPDVVASVASVEVAEGYTCELPSAVDYNDYTFAGWAAATLDEVTTTAPTLYKAGDEYTMGAADTTLYAVYSYSAGGSGNFEKVTSEQVDWSGTYLIVYEGGNVAFNGGLTSLDAAGNYITIEISNNSIVANDTTKAATFEIAKSGDMYTIKSKSGYYIGRNSSSNGLETSTSQQYTNSISMTNGAPTITGEGGIALKYYNGSGARFRYYASNQKAITLYKLNAATVYYTTNLAHVHSLTETPVEATCTTAGGIQKTCDCGYEEFVETAPALGHDYQIASTTPGTCQVKEVINYDCSRCDATKTEEGELGSHDYVDGVCSVCEFVDPLSVDYSGYYYFTFTRADEEVAMYVKTTWSSDRYTAYDDKPTTELSSYLFRVVRNDDGTYNIYEGTSNNLFAKGAENVFVVKNEEYYNIYNADGGYFSMNKDAKYDYVKFYSGNGQICDITFVEYTEIVSAGLTLGEELTMNYKVAMDDTYAGAEMTFTLAGNTTTVTGTKVDGLYVYSLQVAPQFMGENISAVLTLNDETLASKTEYCVKDYIDYQLENTTGEEMTNLLNALLQYGAAAQMYKDYDTDNLVADLSNLGAVPTSTDFTLVANPDVENGYPVYFTGANLNFSSLNTLYVKLSSYDEKVELYVNDEKVELTGTTYSTGGLMATQFNDTFTFVLKYDGIVMQTLTYSVNAYAYQFGQEGKEGAMADLARALYNYGVSTEAYVASLGNQA
ncbi:MAG: hypothetical protein IJF39_02740 [Clostridia bacterium]|nr:hypothetical protein [Clostridia bacterium]